VNTIPLPPVTVITGSIVFRFSCNEAHAPGSMLAAASQAARLSRTGAPGG